MPDNSVDLDELMRLFLLKKSSPQAAYNYMVFALDSIPALVAELREARKAVEAMTYIHEHGLSLFRSTNGVWGFSARGSGGPWDGSSPLAAVLSAMGEGK